MRVVRSLVMGLVVAGLIGVASSALAAGKMECSVTKEGKTTTHMVANAEECTKLGGKIVEHKAKSK